MYLNKSHNKVFKYVSSANKIFLLQILGLSPNINSKNNMDLLCCKYTVHFLFIIIEFKHIRNRQITIFSREYHIINLQINK